MAKWKVFGLSDKKTVYLSPEKYLKLSQSNPNKILESYFIPPVLGTGGLGKFKVVLSTEYKLTLIKKFKWKLF